MSRSFSVTRICLAVGFISTAMLPVLTWMAAIGLIPSVPFLNLLVWLPSIVIASIVHFSRMLRGFLLPILVVLIWTMFSVGWVDSTERGRGLLISAALLTAFGVSVLLWQEEAWLESATLFVYGSAVVAIVMGLYWVNAGFSEFGTLRDAIGTIVTNRNAVASQLGFAALLSLSIALKKTSLRSRRVGGFTLVAVAILLMVSVVLTGSRGGFGAMFAGLIVLALLSRDWKKITLAECIFAFGALLGLGALVLIPNPLTARLVGVDLSQVGDRVPIWGSALRTLEESSIPRWLFGFGTGGPEKAVAMHLSDLTSAVWGPDGILRISTHNSYVEWLVSYGLIGLALAVLAGIWIIVLAIKSDLTTRSVVGLTMLTFFSFYSVSGVIYRLPYSVAGLALFFGYIGMSQMISFQKLPHDSFGRGSFEHGDKLRA